MVFKVYQLITRGSSEEDVGDFFRMNSAKKNESPCQVSAMRHRDGHDQRHAHAHKWQDGARGRHQRGLPAHTVLWLSFQRHWRHTQPNPTIQTRTFPHSFLRSMKFLVAIFQHWFLMPTTQRSSLRRDVEASPLGCSPTPSYKSWLPQVSLCHSCTQHMEDATRTPGAHHRARLDFTKGDPQGPWVTDSKATTAHSEGGRHRIQRVNTETDHTQEWPPGHLLPDNCGHPLFYPWTRKYYKGTTPKCSLSS